jgi:hypothetical protein
VIFPAKSQGCVRKVTSYLLRAKNNQLQLNPCQEPILRPTCQRDGAIS